MLWKPLTNARAAKPSRIFLRRYMHDKIMFLHCSSYVWFSYSHVQRLFIDQLSIKWLFPFKFKLISFKIYHHFCFSNDLLILYNSRFYKNCHISLNINDVFIFFCFPGDNVSIHSGNHNLWKYVWYEKAF